MLRRNKFNAKPITFEGIRFASKAEFSRYCELRLLEKAGYISDLQIQVSIPIIINGVTVCKYIADFIYRDNNGNKCIEDKKGCRKGAAYQMFRLKKKLIQAVYGETVVEV